jgi:hypothetical protein
MKTLALLAVPGFSVFIPVPPAASLRMRPFQRAAVIAAMLTTQFAHAQWGFEGDTTVTWQEAIERYQRMDSLYTGAKLTVIGQDDDGHPIHLFILSDGSGFTPDSIRAAGKNILWITNGIHPGEPDGIDASLMLARALLDSDQLMGLLAHTAVCIVPVYNVSGALDRGSHSRVNQDGPREYGFRGNAKNLDLNRDFMKMDSRNMQAMAQALAQWDPDIYFETHVSDGADHRYIMALLATQKDKLAPSLAKFMTGTLVPGQYQWMERRGMAMCPYFELLGRTPAEGLHGFYDSPRYSTGYNALFNRIGIISESHMLKPYADRVNATFQLLLGTLAAMDRHPEELRLAREEAREYTTTAGGFGMNWVLDKTVKDTLPWSGYAVRTEMSAVTGLPRIRYDHTAPLDTTVEWLDHYRPVIRAVKPKAYLVPRQWEAVVQRLAWSGVPMVVLAKDTLLTVEQDSIGSFSTVPMAYEGHYLHSAISTVRSRKEMRAHAGDVLVPMGHVTDRYAMEALECQAEDGFFAWNFFDGVLQQKEWFDDYVFEPIAARLLEQDPALKASFQRKRAEDPAFAANAWDQLAWIYRRSPWMEPEFRKHPVLRVVK